KVTGMARKIAGVEKENRARAILLRLLAFAIAGFCAWSFIDRDMFGKLFLGLSFDYWDDTRPAIVYFAMMFSIVGMYTFIVHYGRKLLQFRKKAF
ncbi:MAG: hypothetical protein FWG35_08590, partial [Spirochaetaceae bacterium]|nr:hypothetical protein [Spirochaetaceae bacterium]